ncbi:nitrate assimilation regulatory protein nirA [Bipolaris maydis]|nr:nitrate assimilation regulatory protein nirA [Bipolaris maydis]
MSTADTGGNGTKTGRPRKRAAEACTFCRRRKSVSRIVITANGSSSYHGRTSTLFDEGPHEKSASEAHPEMPDEWVERGLVAEAARQRQLETVNFRQGKLDFDGVEPELGMHLLSLHWNRQHHSFLATYRPAFMRDMACGGPYFSKLLLNAIYFGAAKFSPRHEVRRVADDVRTAGWQFRERVRELLGGSLDRSEITTIQAMLVMTNSLFALGDERSAAWIYAGLAFRMIVDLGIHVDTPHLAGSRRLSDEDYEIRRRVFWAAFVIDKIQSLYQGRPVSIKESDTLVPIKFQDTYEELEHWTPFAYSTQSDSTYLGSPAYSVSTFRHLCQLSVILSDILSTIYTERSSDSSPAELSSRLESIHSKLTTWRQNLPEHLAIDAHKVSVTPPPHVLSLHALYNVLTILLHRPFVADGHLYNTSRAISVNSFMACATSADDIVKLLRVYHKAFSVRRAPYLISYATYVAATILARIAARRGPRSPAHRNLETCLAVFRENQETNWAVRRANAIVQNLMKRMGVTTLNPNDALLDRDTDNRGQSSTPDTTAGSSVGREPSLKSIDIDGIIQSFVREREQENALPVQTNAAGNANLPHANLPVQSQWSNSMAGMPAATSYNGQNDGGNIAYDNNGSWMFQGQQPLFGDNTFTTGSKDSASYLGQMESIRRVGAVMMGLAPNVAAAAKVRGTPKLAILSSPQPGGPSGTPDVHVQAFSMGKPHPSLQLTGAACLASAVCIQGTIAHELAEDARRQSSWQSTPERTPSPCSDSDESTSNLLPKQQTVTLAHPSGQISVDALCTSSESFAYVDRCIVSRTARRIFEGKVYYYTDEA